MEKLSSGRIEMNENRWLCKEQLADFRIQQDRDGGIVFMLSLRLRRSKVYRVIRGLTGKRPMSPIAAMANDDQVIVKRCP